MAKDCVFKVTCSKSTEFERAKAVRIEGPDWENWLDMSPREWSAFRSGLMPNSHVDFIIEEEEDGKRSD